MYKNIVLYTLQTFSTTGGIQKMTRTLAHSLYGVSKKNGWRFNVSSLYDTGTDLMPQYLPPQNFEGFNNNRIRFISKSILGARKHNVVILSHINLAIIGLFIRAINPKCQVWLIGHGIEVWYKLPVHKKFLLKNCHKILCVSNFTKQQIIKQHHIEPAKCVVLNNAIDPFMKLPKKFAKPDYLLNRYGLTASTPVVFTLTRLASTEQYKGHDMVIKAISTLKKTFPDIKYILAGKYDDLEKIRVQKLIAGFGVTNNVILTGFITEDEVSDHFLLADIFVLPSKKEGFGLVFIEALACGLPVICGNADGSIDAILNGELGKAINTDNQNELEEAVTTYLTVPLTISKRKYLQDKCLQNFNEQLYIDKLNNLILNMQPNNAG
jgi:phosphatidylinositol alpha-1,6-mannosyltransferase